MKNSLSSPQPTDIVPASQTGRTFNFALVLRGRATSTHTYRAYARWVDRYLADLTELPLTKGKKRKERMENLPLDALLPALNPTTLRAWLGRLAQEEQGKQALNQARASIITLASLLAEAGMLDDYTSASLTNVRIPRAESGQRQGRWLSVEQVRTLMRAAEDIAHTPGQRQRNAVVIRMLCIMALRREEVAAIKWKDFYTQAGRPVLQVHGKGSKTAIVDIPPPVLRTLERWVPYVSINGELDPESYLVRRVYKNGRVETYSGLSTDTIWRIVKDAAEHAKLGRVAPHDLRRSVAGNLELSGVSIETISRLLRHSSIAITQTYLSKLPRQNEGALLMAELLDMDDFDID